MPRFYFNKLVRDNVVDHCLEDPKVLKTEWHELDGEAYRRELVKKAAEEADEIPLTDDDRNEVLSELADLQSVVDALRESAGFTEEEVKVAADEKTAKKGGFTMRRFVSYVDLADDSEWVSEFRKQPDKYPEIKE